MVWIYLAESEDSPLLYLGGSGQSPIVKTIDMPRPFCFPTWEEEQSPLHLYVLTLKNLLRRCCLRSISSMGASPARISVLRVMALAWKEADQDYFLKSSESLANFDQDTFSWKTSQLSLFGGLTEFSWSSLRWGTIVGGRLYQPQKWAPVTSEKDGSYLDTPTVSTASYRNQPTPTATPYGKNQSNSPGARQRLSLHGLATRGLLPGHPKGSLNPEWIEQAMDYPFGWTEIEDWAMQWFRPKREKRSKG